MSDCVIDLTTFDDQDIKTRAWINVRKWKETPYYEWRGLDKGDNIYRLYRKIPYCRKYRKGVLMTSFKMWKLFRIAWDTNVFNPDGFGISDCPFWGISQNIGYELFLQGWKGITKDKLILHIWNRLEETDRILIC